MHYPIVKPNCSCSNFGIITDILDIQITFTVEFLVPYFQTRAVKNWERLAILLLEREYVAIQAEIKEGQQLYMERRQMYMEGVMQDHNDEMAKFALHRQKSATSVQDVDKKFLRCYSAKVY